MKLEKNLKYTTKKSNAQKRGEVKEMRKRKGIRYTENKWQKGSSASLSAITCKWIKLCQSTDRQNF